MSKNIGNRYKRKYFIDMGSFEFFKTTRAGKTENPQPSLCELLCGEKQKTV